MTRAAACLLAVAAMSVCGLPACSPSPDSSAINDRRADGRTSLRIVTLAPHLAELVFTAGAGDKLVGVSAYSNYPDDVLRLPQIGDSFGIDQERLAVLHPDVLLAWESGTPVHTVDELRKRGYRVEVIRTQGLLDVAEALRTVGRISGDAVVAEKAAAHFVAELERLRKSYSAREPIRVFYQISERPLYTVNASHYVSELIELCGGENIFSDLDDLAPAVSEESVLGRNPELLLAGRTGTEERPFKEWLRWSELAANRYDNRFYVDSDLLGRASTRLTRAGAAICRRLDEGRRNRSAATQ